MALNTYLIRKEWLSLGDDFVINSTEEDGEGVAYSVDNKILHLRETYHMSDADGTNIYKIMERNIPNHRVVIYDDDEEKVAVVRKRGDGTYWCHVDDERDIFAEGDASENKLELSNIGGLNVASMSEADLKIFPDGDGFNMVRVRPDQEEDLIMALLVSVQYLVDDEGDDDSDGESDGE
uniref:Uncharacterized protein n=1 Tax=Odontella aurita TaxID=265563 RepID=A0A7S4J3Y2_9STRA|mmetsp:Transcript_37924/g.113311  ORF Transcript_37924/g.113311 Transcript_37924/m.113311 type:complete len:179 (+) Transcript_37924:99-635(+)